MRKLGTRVIELKLKNRNEYANLAFLSFGSVFNFNDRHHYTSYDFGLGWLTQRNGIQLHKNYFTFPISIFVLFLLHHLFDFLPLNGRFFLITSKLSFIQSPPIPNFSTQLETRSSLARGKQSGTKVP